jgi:predicted RNA-binding protein
MAENKEITVRLRVVGVFFDKMITLSTKPDGVTIKDVLDEAQEKSGKTFRYWAEQQYTEKKEYVLSLTSFANKIAELDPSLGGRKRAAGIYEIRETVDAVNGNEIVHAWQYYVIRKGKLVSNAFGGEGDFEVSPASPKSVSSVPPAKVGFTPFNEQGVLDGDEIVWRNVSIARGPTRTKEIE